MLVLQQEAQQILSLIDLTSLNDNDTDLIIKELCQKSATEFGKVPAICIYSRFIPLAKQLITETKIATVVNFPHGSGDLELTKYETELALNRGADEIDLVMPYHALKIQDKNIAAKMVREIKQICASKTLKVIIESGELKTPELIREASIISIENGADFIKTSTGKVATNATLEAAEIMLNIIRQRNPKCGFKAAGGIRSVLEAVKYLELTEEIMGKTWINSDTFRFGASALLGDVINVLNNNISITPSSQAIY